MSVNMVGDIINALKEAGIPTEDGTSWGWKMNRSSPGRLLFGIVVSASVWISASVSAQSASIDTELHHRILNTIESSAPAIFRKTMLFSYAASRGTQAVALAFEHEDYRRLYLYERNRHGIFVLTIPIPDGLRRMRYRLVVDGLWTTDSNTLVENDSRGIPVSTVTIPSPTSAPRPGVKRLSDGTYRFAYRGQPGSRVSLIGDFNRWDPYLNPMPESPIHPGLYIAALSLPADAQIYRYVVDGREIPDPENPVSTRNGWGEAASRLPR